jgi:hypothetical protein
MKDITVESKKNENNVLFRVVVARLRVSSFASRRAVVPAPGDITGRHLQVSPTPDAFNRSLRPRRGLR